MENISLYDLGSEMYSVSYIKNMKTSYFLFSSVYFAYTDSFQFYLCTLYSLFVIIIRSFFAEVQFKVSQTARKSKNYEVLKLHGTALMSDLKNAISPEILIGTMLALLTFLLAKNLKRNIFSCDYTIDSIGECNAVVLKKKVFNPSSSCKRFNTFQRTICSTAKKILQATGTRKSIIVTRVNL